MEWKDKYNSFNSDKGLLYLDWYKEIRKWKDHKVFKPLPPVEASVDPIQQCQLQCSHCNASRYLTNPPKDTQIRMKDDEYIDLMKFLGEWGVKAVCHGGGGEPTLHTALCKALITAKKSGMENSIATNGINFNEELIETSVNTCRWIGVSVDSANAETYLNGRKRDYFDTTIYNIKKLANKARQLNSNCDISYKFLVFEYNQNEIYDACKLAKELGAKDFHARPADLSHQGMSTEYKGKANKYSVKLIKEQFERCHELEDDNFRVFTIVHKFDENFMPQKKFEQCYASPCCIQICPNGEVFLCPDQRYNNKYLLGVWLPKPEQILNFWGNKHHYDLVFNTGKSGCNTRCTFNPYNRQCQEIAIKDNDPFCWKFI